MDGLAELQARLGPAVAANVPGSREPHVVVGLPSFSVGETLLAHYGARMPALEHRFLSALGMLGRIPGCEIVFACARAPSEEALGYLVSLLAPDRREGVRARFHVVALDDPTPGSVADKLLARPDLLAAIRARVAGRPAMIEPWNVTGSEARLALALGVPVNGSPPHLRALAFKGAGRRLMRGAGVPVPEGREDLRDLGAVADAVLALRAANPGLRGVVVKHDDSGAGDGNAVIGLADLADRAALAARLGALPEWYRADLRHGTVVEELVAGEAFASPSVQVDLHPDGSVAVLATHEQVLGGASGQVYMGCRFPADPAYAATLARHGRAVGRALAREGALGRAAIDFACARTGEAWDVRALEINLRKGGTTHPYTTLRHLVPGRYDADAGVWRAEAGGLRAYAASDNLASPAWTGMPEAEAVERVARAGIAFEPGRGTGVALHMLSGLAIDGRLGAVAIGRDAAEADALFEAVAPALG